MSVLDRKYKVGDIVRAFYVKGLFNQIGHIGIICHADEDFTIFISDINRTVMYENISSMKLIKKSNNLSKLCIQGLKYR